MKPKLSEFLKKKTDTSGTTSGKCFTGCDEIRMAKYQLAEMKTIIKESKLKGRLK